MVQPAKFQQWMEENQLGPPKVNITLFNDGKYLRDTKVELVVLDQARTQYYCKYNKQSYKVNIQYDINALNQICNPNLFIDIDKPENLTKLEQIIYEDYVALYKKIQNIVK